MSAHAEAALHGDAHEHHGPPAAHQSSRIHSAVLGMFLFIASEAMLFGSFFTAYFFIRVVNPEATIIQADRWAEWLPCKAPLVDGVCEAGFYEFPVFVAGVNTAILVTSSFTMHWALQSIKRGERNGLRAGLVLTIAMGLAFLLTQMIEYAHVGFNTGDGAFASAFFGLTGLHGAHVFVGLTILTVMAARAFRGHFTPEHHHGVELAGIYWHFVDIMWIIVYVTVYLI
jgi:cytochrome c oxidase subunit 3